MNDFGVISEELGVRGLAGGRVEGVKNEELSVGLPVERSSVSGPVK